MKLCVTYQWYWITVRHCALIQCLYSPQGLHPPFFFLTMCSGLDHGELERWMTPAASILAKAALAAVNFSTESGRTLQWMGAVWAVSMLW